MVRCHRPFVVAALLVCLLLLPAAPAGAATLAELPDASAVVIDEIMLLPADGGAQWVELLNRGGTPIDVSGYLLRDTAGRIYRIPEPLPPMPPGSAVVIYYDGLGATKDRYTFDAHGAALHTPAGLVSPFDALSGHCALLWGSRSLLVPLVLDVHVPATTQPTFGLGGTPLPAEIASFVAWGADPGADAARAIAGGDWTLEGYVPTDGAIGGPSLETGGTLGLYPGAPAEAPAGWVTYAPDQASAGRANPLPAPRPVSPPDGIAALRAGLSLGWTLSSDTMYLLQISDSEPGDDAPAVTVDGVSYTPPDTLPAGTYYWRVAADDGATPPHWSATQRFTTLDEVAPLLAAGESHVLEGITPLLQHKDTNMLCLDGDPETGVAPWDGQHGFQGWAMIANRHDAMYCVPASIAMVAKYYGGTLSQDRIAHYYAGGGGPEGDLSHGKGMWHNGNPTTGAGPRILQWALQTVSITESTPPDYATIRDWIDHGRPILVMERNATGRHSTVVDGYWVTTGDAPMEMVRRVDPWTGQANWVRWDTWEGVETVAVPPEFGAMGRSDEDEDGDLIADTVDDSDGDGICDFDEAHRFPFLDPLNADTDGDGVEDKADMREYLFTVTGRYAPRPADIDGDGRRKEVDPDNDRALDSGAMDGCEDENRDGYPGGPKDTDNFNPSDDRDCNKPVVTITFPPEGFRITDPTDDCCVTLQGKIESNSRITSLYARQVTWYGGYVPFNSSLTWGPAPSYAFSEMRCFGTGSSSIFVRATNETDAGSDFVNISCPGYD